MKLTFALIVSLLLLQLISAQVPNFNINIGDEYNFPEGRNQDLGAVGTPEDGYIQVSSLDKVLLIRKFLSGLKPEKELLIKPESLPKNFSPEQLLNWNGRIYLLLSTLSAKNWLLQLFAQEIDLKKCELRGPCKEIIQCDANIWTDLSGEYYQRFLRPSYFGIELSSDSSRLFIYTRFRAGRSGEALFQTAGISVWVFNNDLSKTWAKDHISYLHNTAAFDAIKSSFADAEGNLLLLAGVKQSDGGQQYFLMKISEKSNEVTEISINPGNDKLIKHAHIFGDAKGYAICAGYYAKKDSPDKVAGSFLFRLDAGSNKLLNMLNGYYEIPDEANHGYMSDSEIKKITRGELSLNYEFRKLIFNDDGTILVLGEEVNNWIVSDLGTPGAGSTPLSNSKSIIVQYISKNGDLIYTEKIPKFQASPDRHFHLGYKVIHSSNAAYVVFEDNPKNMNLTVKQKPDVYVPSSPGIIVAVRIDHSGTSPKTKILEDKEVDFFMDIPNDALIDSKTLVGRIWHKNVSSFAR